MNYSETLRNAAKDILNEVQSYSPFACINSVKTSEHANKQFQKSTLRFKLKQWSMIADDKLIRKNQNLKSRTNTINSIDPSDLYY